MRDVIYTEDYRGKNDEELYLLFKGISVQELIKALSILVPPNNQGVCRQMILVEEDCLYRNGKTPHQVAVQIIDHNDNFCSLSDMFLLIEARIKSDYGYNIKKVNINTFINL